MGSHVEDFFIVGGYFIWIAYAVFFLVRGIRRDSLVWVLTAAPVATIGVLGLVRWFSR